MSELPAKHSEGKQKVNLTRQFMLSGLIAVVLIVSLATLRGYYSLRGYSVRDAGDVVASRVNDVSNRVVASMVGDQNGDAKGLDNSNLVTRLGLTLNRIRDVTSVELYRIDKRYVWSSSPNNTTSSDAAGSVTRASAPQLSERELEAFNRILENPDIDNVVLDERFTEINTWLDAVVNKPKVLPMLVRLTDGTGRDLGIAKLTRDFSGALVGPRHFGFRLLVFALLAALLLFSMLYLNFRRGVKTIERQEQKLTHQISRLSNLLAINKTMQKSIKTASARAVELNEQFLRRVGADLHDGPAQMIGYAVLRLNNVSKNEAAKQFGHEFHAVKEALDESLEEIRGISSGLVLPELEQMSLEECLRKVITLHGAKSDAEVAQFYQDLPQDIPLPIKICAYRFLQEGLNNAHRHGAAEKCRVSAYVQKDELIIALKDNGMGFRKSTLGSGSGVHLGLTGLKDRIESLGGTFAINSELGVGTALKFSVSLNEDA